MTKHEVCVDRDADWGAVESGVDGLGSLLMYRVRI